MTDVPPTASLKSRIEEQLAEAGLQVTVENSEDSLILSGIVQSEEARQAASDIVADVVPDVRIDNQLDVEAILPTGIDDFAADGSTAELAESSEEIEAAGGELEPDFTNQPALYDPLEASGSGHSDGTDPGADGDAVYAPPIDPVVSTDAHGRAHVLGGFGSDEAVSVEASASDRHPGDEALADAVRRELAEDAATTDLTIYVTVRNGVVHLRGQVADLDDADNAESVAARVPGIREVMEELDVSNV